MLSIYPSKSRRSSDVTCMEHPTVCIWWPVAVTYRNFAYIISPVQWLQKVPLISTSFTFYGTPRDAVHIVQMIKSININIIKTIHIHRQELDHWQPMAITHSPSSSTKENASFSLLPQVCVHLQKSLRYPLLHKRCHVAACQVKFEKAMRTQYIRILNLLRYNGNFEYCKHGGVG